MVKFYNILDRSLDLRLRWTITENA